MAGTSFIELILAMFVLFAKALAPTVVKAGERLMVTNEVQLKKDSSPNETNDLQPDKSTIFNE